MHSSKHHIDLLYSQFLWDCKNIKAVRWSIGVNLPKGGNVMHAVGSSRDETPQDNLLVTHSWRASISEFYADYSTLSM